MASTDKKACPSTCFAGKRALVTGGSRGIGLVIAQHLAKLGATVIVLGRNKANLDEAKKQLPENTEFVCVDLLDWKATEAAVKTVLPVHLLVNNAGLGGIKPFGQYVEQDFDTALGGNLKQVLNVSQVVANDLRERKLPGSIVNVSSFASLRPLNLHATYGPSKAGLDGLTHQMALELGPAGIRVNSVNPHVVMTDMGRASWSDPKKSGPVLARTPLGRFAELDEVADAVCFLLSERASFIHGVLLPLDGGYCAV